METINYDGIRMIKKDNSGTTYMVRRNPDNKIVALKVVEINVDITQENIRNMEDSIYSARYLSAMMPESKYISKMYDVFINNNTINIVFEYNITNLIDFLIANPSGIRKPYLVRIYLQLILGLKFIHEHGYAHRNIQPTNISLSDNFTIKYTDFGIACVEKCFYDGCVNLCSNSVRVEKIEPYTPPEIAKAFFQNNTLVSDTLDTGKAQDIWSLGVIMYELAHGRNEYPFEFNTEDDNMKRAENIMNAPTLQANSPGDNTGRVNNFLEAVTKNNPVGRPNINQVLKFLEEDVISIAGFLYQ